MKHISAGITDRGDYHGISKSTSLTSTYFPEMVHLGPSRYSKSMAPPPKETSNRSHGESPKQRWRRSIQKVKQVLKIPRIGRKTKEHETGHSKVDIARDNQRGLHRHGHVTNPANRRNMSTQTTLQHKDIPLQTSLPKSEKIDDTTEPRN